MKKVLFKTSIIFSIIFILLSYASAAIITQILGTALTKENSVVTKFENDRETSKCEEEIIISLYPKDNNSSNIDRSFIIFLKAKGISYSQSESLLQICIYPNKMGQDEIKDLMDKIESLDGVSYADRSYPFRSMEVISEGRDAINATRFVLNGIAGEGVKIAVLDNGFKDYKELQRRGELPKDLIIRDVSLGMDTTDNDHGTKCAEIIFDIVPRATMHLIKVNVEADFGNAIKYCLDNDIKIISCSVGLSEFKSFIAGMDPLDRNLDEGISNNRFLIIVAAGNEAGHSWFGSFHDPSGTGYTLFPSGNDFLSITLPKETKISLIWDDYDPLTSRYCIEVYDQQDSFIEQSVFSGISGHGWVLQSAFPNSFGPGKFKIRIVKEVDTTMPQGRNMRLIFDKGLPSGDVIDNPSDRNPESSLCIPADGHKVLTIGAMNVAQYTSGSIERYSSRGPTRDHWPTNTPGVMKPEIVAPSAVSTLLGGYRGFAGTSAAAPHVAAAAALLLSLNPAINMMDLKAKVISYARQVQSSPDNTYGNGILVLNTDLIPPNDVGDFVCYPNPVSISATGYIKITNLPFNTNLIDIQVYTVTGEFVKSFNAGDMFEEEYTSGNRRRMLEWDLRNQDGTRIAPGVYFVTLKTLLGSKKVKKIAVQM
jgi:subtilisin family serine protease